MTEDIHRVILARVLDEDKALVIVADLPITRNANGYVVDLEGKDDLIVSGDTPEDAMREACDALCEWADDSVAAGRRHADLGGVAHHVVPVARKWAKYPDTDLVPA